MKNLLLIDSEVHDYQIFVESVNEDTLPFVYTPTTTREELLTFIGVTTIERMALVSHETQTFLGEPFYSETNATFFVDTIRQYQIKNLDFLACDTLNNLVWKAFYDNLHTETGVMVGASDNQTGNLKYGGDWILESTSEDIELVYFTKSIEYYQYLLGDYSRTFAVKSDGTLWGTGFNGSGELGDGTTVDKSVFTNISVLQSTGFQSKSIKLVTTGQNHTVILMTDNTLWGCGADWFGTTPVNNKFTQVTLPVGMTGNIQYVSCGGTNTVLYTDNNTLWGAGLSLYGELGVVNTFSTPYTTFQQLQITNMTGTIKAISCGQTFTVVLTSTNKLWVSGRNTQGQLGTGDKDNRTAFVGVNIDTLSGKIPKFIAACSLRTIVAMTDGTLWGTGFNRALGTNNISSMTFIEATNTNTYYNGIRRIKQISSGSGHTLVLMTDGTLWGTGTGSNGEFGATSSYSVYTEITVPTTLKSIYTISNATILLGTNNTLYVNGQNNYGQLGYSTTRSTITTPFTTFPLTDVSLLPDEPIVAPPPTISSIVQASNGVVTINGTNFSMPTVTMTGGYTSGTVTKVNSTQLTFTPSAFIGTSTFTVTDGENSVSLTVNFPTITSFTPTGARNSIVTITGTNLGNVTTVAFGSVIATSPSISSTTITVNAPANVRSVAITLTDSNGNSVATSTPYTYNTNPTLFTSTISDLANNLLSQLSLIDGIADTGILQIGSALTTTNLSGTIYGVTVSSTDNSSILATTAFVKSQNYATQPTLASYAQMALTQSWSAFQTFNGILSSTYDATYNALAAKFIVSVGSNLTTGTLNIGTSTSSTTLSGRSVTINNPTILNPVTIGYTTTSVAEPVRGQMNRQFGLTNTSASTFTSVTGGSIQAVINGLPNGRYLLLAYVYIPYGGAAQRVDQRFGYRNTSLSNGLTTGYSLLGDGIGEVFGYKANNASNYSHNVCQVVDITNGNGNVGVWVATGTTSTNTYATLNMIRIS